MMIIGTTLIAIPAALFGYAYFGYPAVLKVLTASRKRDASAADPAEWPVVTITVPVYNEEHSIRQKIEQLLALDYPTDKRRILVISDASSDGTDAIVREYHDRGVELLRLPARSGKTAAENAAARHLHGSLVVNTDATTRLMPSALKALVRAFNDPTVGVASGRDVSIGDLAREDSGGEAGYVGYEMGVRALETRFGSIVGVSGCFYGIRRALYEEEFPDSLSRDFGCALSARERGFRAVSVDDAVCVVPRTGSLRAEFKRKVRTMQRGLRTLWYKRRLLNPFQYGRFAFMLFSHKLCRWLVPLALPAAGVGLVLLSLESRIAAGVLALTLAGIVLGAIGMRWPESRRVPRVLAVPSFALAATLAGIRAWTEATRGNQGRIWEPTRRPV